MRKSSRPAPTLARPLLFVASLGLVHACAAPPPPPPPAPAPSPAPVPTAAAPAPTASAVATADPAPADEPLPPSLTQPLPEGFQAIAAEGETRCGDFRVEVLPEPGWQYVTFVRVKSAQGKVVYEAHGRVEKAGTDKLHQTLGGTFCGDLTGDGIPELAMTESSGGVHCCYTYYVVSLTTPPKRLLMWEKGDAGTRFVPVKYRPGPAWQLQGWYVFWPPFDTERGDPVLSYASAPVIPAVLSLTGGSYALTSLSFPEAYRRDRDEWRARCAAQKDCSADVSTLFEWVDAVAIGDWDAERAKMPDQALAKALDGRAAATRKKLEKELGTLKAPAKTSK